MWKISVPTLFCLIGTAYAQFSPNPIQPLCNTAFTMNCSNFEPQDGTIIMGWNIDLDRHDTIDAMLARMDGVAGARFSTTTPPGAYGMFMKITSTGLVGQRPDDPLQPEDLDSMLNQLKGKNAIFITSLDPTEGYDNVSPAALTLFANKMAEFNRYGIPVMIRPAHEMNGPWYTYGMQPGKFKEFYIRVWTAVKAVAPQVKFIFAPNLGTGYPWSSIPPKTPLTAADIAIADTNGNGRIDTGDDPYTPYYPGDRYVDWWGASMYYKGSYPYIVNAATPAGEIARQMEEVLGGNVSSYQFAAQRRLPIMFTEMAGSYCAQHTGATNLQTKRQFWTDAFGPETRRRFPLLKLGMWFDYSKWEDDAQRDFSISNANATLPVGQSIVEVAPFFKADIATFPQMIYAPNLQLSGSGNCGCFRYDATGSALNGTPVAAAVQTATRRTIAVATTDPVSFTVNTKTTASSSVRISVGVMFTIFILANLMCLM